MRLVLRKKIELSLKARHFGRATCRCSNIITSASHEVYCTVCKNLIKRFLFQKHSQTLRVI